MTLPTIRDSYIFILPLGENRGKIGAIGATAMHIKVPKFEDQHNEFKERPSNLDREIVAFANTEGGRIFIGVDDQGRPKSIRITNRLRSQITQVISTCEPQIKYNLLEQGSMLVLEIPEGDQKPYKAPSGFYIRIGPNSQKLTRDEIIDFFIAENRLHFDSQIFTSIKDSSELDLVDREEVQKLQERTGFGRRLTRFEFLKNLGLLIEKPAQIDITTAALLLCSKQPQEWFPQARTIVWLMGSKTQILDQSLFTGNLFDQLESAVSYISRNIRTRYVINGLKREEIPEFSEEVLRELVLNGLVHRNYFEKSSELQIKIFPELIEFANPANLPRHLNAAEMRGRTFRTNPLLAEVFQRVGYIERAGTGLLRVDEFLEQNYSTALGLKSDGVFFVASLPRPNNQTWANPPITTLPRSTDQKILNLLSSTAPLPSKEIAEQLQVSVRTVRLHLKKLLEQDLVVQEAIGRQRLYTRRQ